MSLPIEERLKNIEHQFRELESAVYYGHPIEDKVFTGVIKAVVNTVNADTTCTAYLEVSPWTPYDPGDKGDLSFIEIADHPLADVDANTRVDRVYVNNVPPDLIRLFFRVGETVKYWHYSGIGFTSDQADSIKGSYVTTVDEWAFWAKIDWDAGANKYTFTAVEYAVEAQDTGFPEVALCDDGSVFFTGYCDDFDNMFGTVRSKRRPTPFVTKVYRFVNPVKTSTPTYEYYFHATVVIHWGKVTSFSDCYTSATVRPCNKDGTYCSSNPAITVTVEAGGCNAASCAQVGDVIPYILYTDTNGVWVNPKTSVGVAYLCGVSDEVDDVSRLEFADVDFDIAKATLSGCSTDSVAQIRAKGINVTAYGGASDCNAKHIHLDVATGTTTEAPVTFTVNCADEVLADPAGCAEADRTIKKATVTGTIKIKSVSLVTDVECNGDGTITVTKDNFYVIDQ